MNELERDDAWQRSVFDRLLADVLREHSHQRSIVYIDIANPVAQLLQRKAHIDAIAQTATGTLSFEFKIVRWPGVKRGCPGRSHYRDMCLEIWSCSVPGHKAPGWMATSKADILLWCQCSVDERSLDCWPFPFAALRTWARAHYHELREPDPVPNVIDGRALFTRIKLAPINRVCRALHVEGFRVIEGGLVTDLFGTPDLRFLQGAA